MQDPDLTDDEYAVLARFRLSLRQFLAFSEARAQAEGLTPQQHQALLAIRAAPVGSATVGMIAGWLMIRPHSASGLIDRLEALGLVTRQASPNDRRQARIVLSDQAAALLARLSHTHREEIRRIGPMLIELLNAIGRD
jgi:DNA-binding MarR family transcriptional regulator